MPYHVVFFLCHFFGYLLETRVKLLGSYHKREEGYGWMPFAVQMIDGEKLSIKALYPGKSIIVSGIR